MDTSCTPNTNAPQRDAKGRFARGNTGGPGNPFARQTAKLRQAALEAVTEEDIRAAMRVLKEKALQGDVAALKLLFAYTIGKPQPAVDPDTLDLEELQLIMQKHSTPADVVERVVGCTPVELLLKMLRAMLPGLQRDKESMAAKVLSQPEEIEEEVSEEEAAAYEKARM